MLTKEDIDMIRAAIKEELKPIQEDITKIKEQVTAIDDSIGMLAEWADSVAVITKVPFASGGTQVK